MNWRGYFPERLRQAREAKGLTKTALGQMAGVTNVSIREFEIGRKVPTVDIATFGEIGRQLRRERIAELVSGIYISLQGDNAEMMQTIGLLAAVDACRFAAAAKAFRERNPAPAVGHFVPRRAKRSKLVAHGWGRSSGGPMGCAQIRGLDRTLAESRDFTISK